MGNKKFSGSYRIVGIAILIAVIIVLQLLSGFFKVGLVSLSFVLIPIVLGGVFYGKGVGTILGLVFGVICAVMGIVGMDGFTHILFIYSPIITILICLVKGALAGFMGGFVFEKFGKQNEKKGILISSIVTPVVNTGLFLIGSIFLLDIISVYILEGGSLLYFFSFSIVVCNFIPELIINIVCASALYRVFKAVKKR